MSPSENELHALEIAEKVSSILSVLGAAFVITTFSLDKRFRKPINRLVFYASFGNLFANVATIISRSSFKFGGDAGLCQIQAFLIQWFLPADALWTFAMACNVWLTFFCQFDSISLRQLEWKYLCFCYGLPFFPAMIYLFVKSAERGKVYGPAVLWCWISEDWGALRIATLYGPVWLFIIANVFIYVKVGLVVFKWRSQLLSKSDRKGAAIVQSSVLVRDIEAPPPGKSYEVRIHSQVPHEPDRSRSSKVDFEKELASPTIPKHRRYGSLQSPTYSFPSQTTTVIHQPNLVNINANKATISYCYTALLFFIALLVTWVPSTVNRLWTLSDPSSVSPFALDFASGLVLPLQGFWNCVIYIFTSQPACKALLGDIKARFSPSRFEPSTSFDMPGTGRWKRGSQPLGSTDNHADITITINGKERIIRRRSCEGLSPGNDVVPDMVLPSHFKPGSCDSKQNSPTEEATMVDEECPSSPCPSEQSHRDSRRSSSVSLVNADQTDVHKHKRTASEKSSVGLAT